MNTQEHEPSRAEVDALPGLVLLEFGAHWCGYCRAAAPAIERALQDHPDVRHLKIEDGPGKLLGRSFRVKLWPTLVFLRDGAVVEIVARPEGEDIQRGFEALTGNVSGATESP